MISQQSNKNILLSVALLIILFLSGCNKKSINGDLDGRWQIMEIERNGVSEYVKDQQLYYNFYLHVCNLSWYGFFYTDGNMKYEDKTLWLQFPYINTPQGIEKLKDYGIYSNPVTFQVELLTKSKLILKEGDLIITLRKF